MVLAFLWLVLFSIQFIYDEPENDNRKFIPASAHVVICIDGNLAIKTILDDLVSFDNQELIDELNTTEFDTKREELGINFNSEIYLFSLEHDGSNFQGALFNLNDTDDFESTFKKTESNSVHIASNSSVGLILINNDESQNQTSNKKLTALASTIMNDKANMYDSYFAENRSSSVINLWSREKNKEAFNWASLELSMHESVISMSGDFVSDEISTDGQLPKLAINPSMFHASMDFLSKTINDSIIDQFTEQIPDLLGMSMNYSSVKIVQEPYFTLVPNADFIYHFTDTVHGESLLRQFNEDSTITDLTSSTFDFHGTTFHYAQLTSRSIFLGRTGFDSSLITSAPYAFVLKGKPDVFTQIEGNSFLMRLLDIFPMYRAGKGMAHAIEDIDVKVSQKSKVNFKLEGKIEFKKDRIASIELLLFLLETGN